MCASARRSSEEIAVRRSNIPRNHGLRRCLEQDTRLLRHRRGRGVGRGRLPHRRGAPARVRRPAERPPARAAPRTPRGARRLDRPRARDGAHERPPPAAAARARAAPASRGREPSDRGRQCESPPRPPAKLQRRAADRRPVQGGRSGHPQPPGLRPGSLQAADRLRERAHLCPRRRHAAGRRQGLPPDSAERRGVGGGARADARARRFLQPGVGTARLTANAGLNGRHGHRHPARGRDHLGTKLRAGLRDRLHADHLRVHPHELGPDAVLALVEPDPALPARRHGAIPAALSARPSVDGAARPLAVDRRDRALAARGSADQHPRAIPLERGGAMALTPVEIRRLHPPTRFFGYNRGHTDGLFDEIAASFEDVWRERADLADKVEQLETDLVRYKELESLLRTTLISAERASAELKEQARREAELILTEARTEARRLQREAFVENERLLVESRKLKLAMRIALESLDDVAPDGDDVKEQPEAADDGQNTWPGEREAA